MRILVVTPTSDEYRLFKKSLKSIKTKNKYLVLETGIGKINAAAAVSLELYGSEHNYDLVAVVGFAAGSECYKQGDLVIPSYVVCHDFKVPPEFAIPPIELSGNEECTCLTGDVFVTKENYRQIAELSLHKNYIFDMETYAVAHVANEIPTICIKLISDTPSLSEDTSAYIKFVESEPSFSQFVYYLESL